MYFYILFTIFALIILIVTLKKPFWSLLILLFLLPFHAFLVTYLRHVLNLNETQGLILSLWKEWIIFTLLFPAIWTIIKEKKKALKIHWFDWCIIVLFILSLISIIWTPKNLNLIFFGLRFDFLFFALYFVVRLLKFKSRELLYILGTVLLSALIVILFGILQSTILPWDFLNRFGYTYSLEWLPGQALQSSQIVGAEREYSRIISTLAGPNSLGSYLVVVSAFVLVLIYLSNNLWLRLGFTFYFLALLLPLFRTYSRSAWIALFVVIIAFIIYLMTQFKRKPAPKGGFFFLLGFLFLLVGIIVGSILYIFTKKRTSLVEVFWRSFSTTEHVRLFKQAGQDIINNPFGKGIGASGPASQWATGIKELTESTYLQMGVEYGFLGLILFTLSIIGMIIKLFKEAVLTKIGINKAVLLGSSLALIGLSVNALFTHAFTDTVTILTLFALIGASISNNEKKIEVIFH